MTGHKLSIPFDLIANEYYDTAHLTSRNFDQTTLAAIQQIRALVPATGLVLDVGCGRGRAKEYLEIDASRIVQLDNSKVMLEVQPREAALLRVWHKAETLPFIDGQFACVAGFLCDSFLGLNFLSEAYRVLNDDGELVLTTPSYEWAQALRSKLQIDTLTTRFRLRTGELLFVPSNILPAEQIIEMLKHIGFKADKMHFQKHKLPNNTSPVSPDILDPARELGYNSPYELDILYSIAANK